MHPKSLPELFYKFSYYKLINILILTTIKNLCYHFINLIS